MKKISFTPLTDKPGSSPLPTTYILSLIVTAAKPCLGVGIGIDDFHSLETVLYSSLLLKVLLGR